MTRLTVTVHYISFQANSTTIEGTLAEAHNQAERSIYVSPFNPLSNSLRTLYCPHLIEIQRSKEDCPRSLAE